MAWLDRCSIDPAVIALRPDYRVMLILAEGLRGGPSDERSDALLAAAEASVLDRLDGAGPETLQQIEQWRAAFLAFGVKPRVARCSVEALMRRSGNGVPRIDRLTDTYNAISLRYALPLGGEDLDTYQGPARLVVADGHEPFETVADGNAVVDHPAPGEVVWRDDAGVTCRRWNWRQCTRTRLTEHTTRALFILDGLGTDAAAHVTEAGEQLAYALSESSPGVCLTSRLLPH
jgi:DNA/RNA-binding domain of Phe-tRNA-synthetase-like protein